MTNWRAKATFLVGIAILSGTDEVYDLSIAPYHNYFSGVLVHNRDTNECF